MSFQIPNIRHLRVFYEVDSCKTISKASERVFLSQPAVTQAIAKLEQVMGAQLFERKSNGMYTTEAGRALVVRVERALEFIAAGIRQAMRSGNSSTRMMMDTIVHAVNTTHLRALIAVTESENFSIAAKTLGVSQSSVHRAARDLEKLLEIRFFEKSSRGIIATKAAQLLTKASKLAFLEIEQGWYEIAALNNRDSGHIVVGAMALARTFLLAPTIIGFSNTNPDCTVSVYDGPYHHLLHHLLIGDIDLLVGALNESHPNDEIVQRAMFSLSLDLVARPNHPLANKKNVDINDLKSSSWVLPSRGSPTWNIFESVFEAENMDLPARYIETGSQALSKELLLTGDYLSLMSVYQIEKELASGALQLVDYPLEVSRPIGITTRKGWRPTKAQQTFINLLEDQMLKSV